MEAEITVQLDRDLADALVRSRKAGQWRLNTTPTSDAAAIVISTDAGADEADVVFPRHDLAEFVSELCNTVRGARTTPTLGVVLTHGRQRVDAQVVAAASTLLPLLALWLDISENDGTVGSPFPTM